MNLTFTVDGVAYVITVMQEPEVANDPTLLLFRGDDEEPLVTLHLNPDAPCENVDEPMHGVARPEDPR
jgi:hypothetical protein